MSGPIAALDAGTNTLRLLLVSADGTAEIDRLVRYVFLGEGVDASGQFTDAAMQRGWDAVAEYGELMREVGCTHARFVATSASRDAANREVFFDGVRERIGVTPELISGAEEAALSFAGALAGVDDVRSPVAVVDAGGGSTEIVLGDDHGISNAVSLDVGSRRIRERFFSDDPPTAGQVKQARAFVNDLLDDTGIDFSGIRTLIGVAGTVTTLTALTEGLERYDRDVVHGAKVEASKITKLTKQLLGMSTEDIAELGPVAPQRAPVLSAGAVIVDEIVSRVGRSLQASESDILDGVILSILDQADRYRL